MQITTDIIDQLFLELSQVTEAETKKEKEYRDALRRISDALPPEHPVRPIATEALRRAQYM